MAYTGIWIDTLPWSDTENDRKLVGYVFIAMAVSTVLFVIMQFLPLMDVQEKKLEEVAPRLAKLIIEKQAQPKPPPPLPIPKPKEKPKPKPKPKTEKKPIPKPKPKTAPKPKPDRAEVAKKQAQRQMQVVEDALADLREFDVASLDKNKPIKSGATTATSTATTNTTAIIAARAKEGSGGINTSSLTRATGGGDLAGRQTTNVQSSLGAGGGVKGTRSGGGSGLASRPNEEVELVFQRNKGRFNSLYQRALRSDPSLQGKVVVKLKIAASGKVLDCRVVSSDLHNPELEKKIVDRILLFKFKPMNNVDILEVTYPLDFLPS